LTFVKNFNCENSLKALSFLSVFFLIIWYANSAQAQSCSVTISGSQNWSTATWSCSGGASAPTTDGMLFVGDLDINLNSGAAFTADIDITIDGDIDFVTNGNTDFIVKAGKTLDVNGDFDASNENNIGIAINGKLQVAGTLEVKNGNSFGGSGIVSGAHLIVKNNNTCGAGGCPTIAFSTCVDGNNDFCDNNNPGGPLEIELEDVQASERDGQLVLNWSVSSTHDLVYHAVEASRDGVSWERIENVDVAEWVSGFPSYHEVIVSSSSYSFFRVKMVNSIQEVAISNVIHWSPSIESERRSGVDVVQELGIVRLTNQADVQQLVHIISLSGEVLWTSTLDADRTVQVDKDRFQGPCLLLISPIQSTESTVTKIFMY